MGGRRRGRTLFELSRRVGVDRWLLASLEAMDAAKPVRESREGDVPLLEAALEHYASWALEGAEEPGGRTPLGVVVQMLSWDAPLAELASKAIPALAAGCCVVVVPADQALLSAVAFASAAREAGLHPGVLNVVVGSDEVREAVPDHPEVDAIVWTGSPDEGRRLRREAVGSGKVLLLESQGPIRVLVHGDADLDSAVEGVLEAGWGRSGRHGSSGCVVLVQEGVAGSFEEKLRLRMERLRVGDPLDPTVEMGSALGAGHLDRIRRLVGSLEEEGGRVTMPSAGLSGEGSFHPPVLCTALPAGQVWGDAWPVVTLSTFRTLDEALSLADGSGRGPTAHVWTESLDKALRSGSRLQARVISVNGVHPPFPASVREGDVVGGGGGMPGTDPEDFLLPLRDGGSRAPCPLRSRVIPAGGGADGGGRRTPGSGDELFVVGADGSVKGTVRRGDAVDVARAVATARAGATEWAATRRARRGHVLRTAAHLLEARRDALVHRLIGEAGIGDDEAAVEVELSARRLLEYATARGPGVATGAAAEGFVRTVFVDPSGVLGIVAPAAAPLLGFMSLVAPALATGNAVVVVPSAAYPLVALDVIRIFQETGLPHGVLAPVTGVPKELLVPLATDRRVDGIWYFGGDPALGGELERLASTDSKRTWWDPDASRAWASPVEGFGDLFLRQATRLRVLQLPFGT
jgi:aldehyde dehydrogenase (NAD+)